MPEKMKTFLSPIREYYEQRLRQYGTTAAGVDWNSEAVQELRFRELLRIVDGDGTFSINDYGCGYGALLDFLAAQGLAFRYCGFDISNEMTDAARRKHAGLDFCEFLSSESGLRPADYAVASGVFNVKLEVGDDIWQDHVLASLKLLRSLGTRGFAFNLLTSYSDASHMQPRLYYANPCFYFDYCKRTFSRHVALLHDYGLYEFTVLVRN
jgi:SAM-dependent methyltransferase